MRQLLNLVSHRLEATTSRTRVVISLACALALAVLVIGFAVLTRAHGFSNEILFRSEESRTVNDGPVFNRVHFESHGARDIWMMNQSHFGVDASADKWDRLAIVVDLETKTARFYQFDPGKLAWSESLPQTSQKEFRVQCALCHSNGPRAIRPEPKEERTMNDWLQTALWNIKIKRYPRLHSQAGEGVARQVPFQFEGHFANSPLKVAVCVYCHREDGPIARGTLRRQNALTIASMVDKGHMPPLGIPLPASQRRELERFLLGF